MFENGDTATYAANIIAEAVYGQVDSKGNTYALIDEIIDHRKDRSAIPKGNGWFKSNGHMYAKWTTHGWFLCVHWKDGTTSWEKLKDLKESYPVQVAEYADANRILDEPAFLWWAPKTLKR